MILQQATKGEVSSLVTVEVPKLQLTVPFPSSDSPGIKDWICQHYQHDILKHMQLRSVQQEDVLHEEPEQEQSGEPNSREQELAEANACLARANTLLRKASAAQLEQFACISHEIRTPLNCIVGLSSLLLQEPQKQWTAAHTESIKMIASSGDLLLTVVNDVLDYAKLESGNVEIQYQRGNLQETLNSIVYSLETKAAQKEDPVSVRTFWDDCLPEFVTMDSCRLQQILYNIMGNALKFSKPGGIIEFTVSVVDPSTNGKEGSTSSYTVAPSDEHGLSSSHWNESKGGLNPANGPNLRFRVKDYGKGVEAKDFARIFQPFRQASTETEQVYGGTGLGLPVTAKLVHAMDGTITIDSDGESWTEFSVDLPFRDSVVNLREEAQPTPTTIYLIDEDEDNAWQFMKTIQRICSRDVEVEHFWTMNDMEESICNGGPLDRRRTFICLVDEDLYEPDAYDLLGNLATSLLVTFGPNYLVRERSAHFRAPNRILPSVLLRSLRDLVASSTDSTSSKRPSLTRSLSFSSINSIPAPELRVLIAEDNIVNQKVLNRLLDRLGVENITTVDNGKEAVDICLTTEFDVVFMDMQMPIMDGVEASKRILRHGDIVEKPKIVFATAHASQSVEVECREAGAYDFLPKPFTLRDLERCLNGLEAPYNASCSSLPYGEESEAETEALSDVEASWVQSNMQNSFIE